MSMHVELKTQKYTDFFQAIVDHPSFKDKKDSDFHDVYRSAKNALDNTSYHSRNECNISIETDNKNLVTALLELSKEHDVRPLTLRLNPFNNYYAQGLKSKIVNIEVLKKAFVDAFIKNKKDVNGNGWIFVNENNVCLPYAVCDVAIKTDRENNRWLELSTQFIDTEDRRIEESEHLSSVESRNFIIRDTDVSGKSFSEVLDGLRIIFESAELLEEYQFFNKKFQEYTKMGHAVFMNNSELTYRSHYEDYRVKPCTKMVSEEGLFIRKICDSIESDFFEERIPLPTHPILILFSLADLHHLSSHVKFIDPYAFKRELKDKLILPEEHKDMIDILTSELETLNDIIDGKSGGTSIICTGSPGLGKTLTAEVYSEVVGRPLYRVNASTLGLDGESIEKNLEIIFTRSMRWNAVALIDEADIYIRRRTDDMNHNAVVASFLRKMEYFDGLMFMTTNRGDDVDDAIMSRCIAHIKYETPSAVSAKRIWKMLSTEFKHPLSDSLIDQLVVSFPKNSGRDIKELLKLTIRYCDSKKKAIDHDSFVKMSTFRGM